MPNWSPFQCMYWTASKYKTGFSSRSPIRWLQPITTHATNRHQCFTQQHIIPWANTDAAKITPSWPATTSEFPIFYYGISRQFILYYLTHFMQLLQLYNHRSCPIIDFTVPCFFDYIITGIIAHNIKMSFSKSPSANAEQFQFTCDTL